jgi:hypothetical protein
MQLYHYIDTTTKLVVYADKPEAGSLEEVITANPAFTIVASQTGEANAPRIFPGFLFHDNTFWAPLRSASQVTNGNTVLDKDEFLRLFTFAELADVYNFEDDIGISVENKRLIKAFLRYLDGATRVSLSHPTVIAGLDFFITVGYLTVERKAEVLTAVFKQ